MKISTADKIIYRKYIKNRQRMALYSGDVFTKYLAIQSQGYLNLINKLAHQLPRIDSGKKIFVLIPAFYEKNAIEQTLDVLIPKGSKALSFWRDKVVFVILNNYCNNKPETETARLVQDFKQKKQFEDIFVINYAFSDNHSNVGLCRKILHDLIILKARNWGVNLKDTIFASFDADMLWVDIRIFSKAYQIMYRDNKVDAIQGKMTRMPRNIYKNTLFYLYSAIYDEIRNEWQSRKYRINGMPKYNLMWNRIFTYGSNLFLKPEVYCKIGGFDNLKIGEDYAIGAKISFLRATGGDVLKSLNVNTIRSLNYLAVNHPRRDLYAFIHETSAYQKFGKYTHDQKIRRVGANWQSIYKKHHERIPVNTSTVSAILSVLLKKSFKRIPDPRENGAIVKRAICRVIRNNRKQFSVKVNQLLAIAVGK